MSYQEARTEQVGVDGTREGHRRTETIRVKKESHSEWSGQEGSPD